VNKWDVLWLSWFCAFLAMEGRGILFDPWHSLSGLVWRLTATWWAKYALGVVIGLVTVHLLVPPKWDDPLITVPVIQPCPDTDVLVATAAADLRATDITANVATWAAYDATVRAEYGAPATPEGTAYVPGE